jgi:hypothetical protein
MKSEDRNPRRERRPKPEIREWLDPVVCYSVGMAMDSDFGFRASFGLRSSVFGTSTDRNDFRAAVIALPTAPDSDSCFPFAKILPENRLPWFLT